MRSDAVGLEATSQFKQVRLGDIFARRAEAGLPGLPVVAVTMNQGLVNRDANERRVETRLEANQHLLVRKGDIVYNMMRMWQGACGLATTDCLVSPAYVVLRPLTGVSPAFAYHLFKSPELIAEFRRHSRGLTEDRLRLYYEEFRSLQVHIPVLHATQIAIADAADLLDRLIRQTEALIAKQRLTKAGLLHELLTRGLDEQGQLRDPVAHPEQFKDTPLGKMPKNWSLSNVESEFDITSGFTLGQHRRPRRNPRKYLRVANVQRDAIDLSELLELEASESEMTGMRLEAGDLLIVEGHADPGQIGRCAIVCDKAIGLTFQNHLFRLRPYRMDAEFGNAWLNGEWVRAYWRQQCGTSSGLNTINRTMLKAVQVAVPNLDEQRRIIEAARVTTARVRTEETYLAKLRLQKRGLMNDLLTGRVRV